MLIQYLLLEDKKYSANVYVCLICGFNKHPKDTDEDKVSNHYDECPEVAGFEI